MTQKKRGRERGGGEEEAVERGWGEQDGSQGDWGKRGEVEMRTEKQEGRKEEGGGE